MLNTPTGTSLVADYNRFIWHTLYAEIGFSMAIASLFFLISALGPQKFKSSIKICSIIVAFGYLMLSGIDDELQRWMSQKLSLSFIKTYLYAFSDTELVSKIALGGLGHFLLTLSTIFFFVLLLIILAAKSNFDFSKKLPKSKKIISTLLIFSITALGCTSHLWYHYSPRRWDRIRPVVYTLVSDLLESSEFDKKPADYREGILLLGGNPDSEYPFWHESTDEEKSINEFKHKDLKEKKNIILLTIESLRGWTFDMRVPTNCQLFPNFCKLSHKSLYFPNTYSVGNPSVEGLLGIMTGIMSLPNKTLLRDFPNTKLKSFSEILSDAGYYNEVILGADPRFDNEEGWYSKWFDYYEFKPEYADDVSSAKRFIERYKARPKDKPTFFHWMSLSMHTPFILPESMGETPHDIGKAYTRAAVYMDSALGIILDGLESDPDFQNTLIILTGDHAAPNGAQQQISEKLGLGIEGYSWISLMFSGPGIEPRLDSRIVSQMNISKTIIDYIGLDVSNHFMGINLLQDSLVNQILPAIYSSKYGSLAMRKDSTAYYLVPVQGNTSAIARQIVLQPTWDTSDPSDGFVTGNATTESDEKILEITKQMRAVASAWSYVVYTNKIMP